MPPWESPPWYYWATFAPAYPSYLHNAANALDVSGDLLVTPLDVLLIINELNAPQTSHFRAFLDTSGDGLLSPIDALLVINMLNANAVGSGEDSAAVSTSLDAAHRDSVDLAILAFWAQGFQRKVWGVHSQRAPLQES